MGATFQIRPALAGDIECIHSIDRAIESAPHWAIVDYLAALSPIEHKSGSPGTGRCFFVAEDASGVLGFAVGKVTVLEAEVLAELESVAVVESARRSGIGKALCKAVMKWSRRLGALEIELEVRSRGAGAIALYEKLAFAPVGLRKDYYRDPADDAILMRLALATNRSLKIKSGRDL